MSLLLTTLVYSAISPSRPRQERQQQEPQPSITQPAARMDDAMIEEPMEVVDTTQEFGEEETENAGGVLHGYGDVNQFKTPVRGERPFEVDSKTITRPRKPSAQTTALPEIFSDEKEPAFTPVSTSTPITHTMSTQSAASPATSSTATAPTAVSPSPAPAAAAPPAPRSSQQSSSSSRPAGDAAARHKTMVVSTGVSTAVKAAIEAEKTAGAIDGTVAARLEARLLAIVQDKEREYAGKSEKLGQMMVTQRAELEQQNEYLKAQYEFAMATVKTYENYVPELENKLAAAKNGGGGGATGLRGSAPSVGGPSAMSEETRAELTRVRREIERLTAENTSLHGQYDSLHVTYNQQRQVIPVLKKENEDLTARLAHSIDRYQRLKQQATEKLDLASEENEGLRQQAIAAASEHESDTVAIRSRLRLRESEIDELKQTLEQKKRQVVNLKEICDELIRKADVDASYTE